MPPMETKYKTYKKALSQEYTVKYDFEMTNYEYKLYFSDPHYGYIDDNDTWDLLQFRYMLIYLP
ncbi:hypothetical protein MTBBW1_1040042 [Desulfamplus magnetovallimortis]|uniref:Uncharacterized protein n=1 Tax=Desulfamplus magnetovallimortis TaxID=1246637 RepID=A0A1W1H5D5_9BACT|nr:hypothetical protein [Desulfamplus magnetovallimortis]SLM27585.1 hypothetical protein MTBBW1_1040042 [Desulfamplus magnetovallimortis]